MSFNSNTSILKHELGNVEIPGDLIICAELCIYKASYKIDEQNKTMLLNYVEQCAKRNPTVIGSQPRYHSFCWEIFSTPSVDLICCGFLRQHFSNYKFIGHNIIETIKWFLEFDGQIELNKVKNAKLNEGFDSPVQYM